MKYNMLSTLISLGVHIGHLKHLTNVSNHHFILGSRNSVEILDIKQIVFSLKKASNFMYQLGQLKSDLLFHVTSISEYDYNIKFFFVHLIHVHYNQRIFDEKWVFGQLGNFKKNALSILQQLFFVRNKSISMYSSSPTKRLFYFRYKVMKVRKGRFVKRRKYNSRTFKKHNLNNIVFFDLLMRVVFYSYFKKIEGVDFDIHQRLTLKFFKFVLLFKYFKTFLVMPDAFVITNNKNVASPILELMSYKIPIVGLIDSNTDCFGISYPVYSNDDSILLSIFYFKLFMKMYTWGKMKRFM